VPFCHWINLLHSGTLLHGPFKCASVNGRKTRDQISPADWDALAKFSSLYQNPLPRFDLPSYSIHVDRGIHSTFYDQANADNLPIAATIVFIPGDKRLSGKDTIVTPIFLGSQKGPDGGYPSGENCEALLDSAKEFAQGH